MKYILTIILPPRNQQHLVDICAKTFKLKSDNGDDKVIACENTEEFMRVLDVCDKMLEPEMIVYAELALTSDK